MKKIFLIVIVFVGLSAVSYAQSGKEKSGGFFSGFGLKKQHKQMTHFDQQKKDPNIQYNGTSYRKERKSGYVVDGDGFGTPSQGKNKKKKKK